MTRCRWNALNPYDEHSPLIVPSEDLRALEAEVARLRDAVREYASHQSWRCEHPPHYYLADDPRPEAGCPCGLNETLRALGLAQDDGTPTP